MYGCLYAESFDASNSSQNNLVCGDGSHDNNYEDLSLFVEYLYSSNTYILVITTTSPRDYGRYSIIVIGPSSVSMTPTTSSCKLEFFVV